MSGSKAVVGKGSGMPQGASPLQWAVEYGPDFNVISIRPYNTSEKFRFLTTPHLILRGVDELDALQQAMKIFSKGNRDE